MNMHLLRADPAWRASRVVAPIAGAIAATHVLFLEWQLSIFAGAIATSNPKFPHAIAQSMLMSVVIASMAVSFAEGMHRGPIGEFGLSLPVSGRSLIGHRFVALLTVAWLPLAAAVAVGLFFVSDASLRWKLAVSGANLAATLFAGVLLWLLFALRTQRRRKLASLTAIGIVGVVAGFAVSIPTLIFAIVVLVIAIPLGIALNRASVRPITLETEGRWAVRRADAGADAEDVGPRRGLGWLILRSTCLSAPAVAMGASAFVVSVLASFASSGAAIEFLMPLMFTAFMVLNGAHVLRKTSPLPIPRFRMLPSIVLPSLACLWLGTAAGGLLSRNLVRNPVFSPVDFTSMANAYGDGEAAIQVVVPRELWRFVSGAPPAIEAPWGETVKPVARTFLPLIFVRAYNPFEIGRESSERFAAWQLHRALEATYGSAPPDGEIASRFVDRNALHKLDLRADARDAWRDMQPARAPADVRDLFTRLMLVWAAWLSVAFACLGRHTPPMNRAQRALRWARNGLAAAVLLLPISIPLVLIAMVPDAVETFEALTFASARDLLPASAVGCIAVLAALVAASLLVLARRFRFTEVPFVPVDAKNPGARAFLNA